MITSRTLALSATAFVLLGPAMTTANSEDTYFTAQGEEDGKPLVFRSLQNVPSGLRASEMPHLVSITWRYEHDGSGMPDAETNEQQIEFEDALASLDTNETSRLMLVVTGNGRKEWHWYVRDIGRWMESLNRLLSGHPVFPLEISDSYQPDWKLYRNFIGNVQGL